ncbi:MAG: response regulator transcription factor [Magnetococcales bacterium]|nr:response regulator transcription factor [Magnetococcales bacterium]MBF0612093.1 response regulator transcription factor [Magnetococcales bacterium]NGZ27148.1 response regulator transcription factor [Magnetococcales bacterium]
MKGGFNILIVEDDPVTQSSLKSCFEKDGFRVKTASDGVEMRNVLKKGAFDVVIMDVGLPGEDGFSLTQQLRVLSRIGIIILSGMSENSDRVVGLELGADDYIVKPYNERELLLRVRNLLARLNMTSRDKSEEMRFGPWVLHPENKRAVHDKGHQVELTHGETNLLHALARRPGRVLSRQQLLDAISGRDWQPSDRTVDVLVRRLRGKLEEDSSKPRLLLTVHGVGYQLSLRGGRPGDWLPDLRNNY